MESFFRATRHRHDDGLLERKFLCTQLPIEWRSAYGMVSDDLAAIEFRAPGVMDTYATTPRMPPKVLKRMLVGMPVPKDAPVLVRDFAMHNPSVPKDKMMWAFFLCGRKASLDEHLEGDPDAAVIRQAVRAYKPPVADLETAHELGQMVATMQINEEEQEGEEEGEEEEEEGEEKEEEKAPKSLTSATVPVADVRDLDDNWSNPVFQAFKAEAQLPTQFPTHKIMKQILLAPERHPAVMGKHQLVVPSVPDIGAAFGLVDAAPEAAIRELLKDQPLLANEGRAAVKELLRRGMIAAEKILEHL